MKISTKIELINAVILIIYGIVILALPVINVTDPTILLYVMFGIFGFISLYKFLCTYNKEKDYDGLYTFIACLISIILMIFINTKEVPFELVIVIISWVFMMALVKLKKGDYYHDRKNKLWIIKVVSMVLFVIAGILTSINLYNVDYQVFSLGYFFFFHGTLELMEPLYSYIIKKN